MGHRDRADQGWRADRRALYGECCARLDTSTPVASHGAVSAVAVAHLLEPIGEPAPPIGLFDQIDVQAVATRLAVGDSIIVTSDGVTEARTPSGEFVDELFDRVLPSVAGQSAATIANAVDGAVVAVERARTRDDVTIVVISRTG